MITPDKDFVGNDLGPLTEFSALRTEINQTANNMWNVLALQISVSGAIFGFSLSGPHRELLLLIIPLSTYMLCGRYVISRYGIRLMAEYIKSDLSIRIPGGVKWEFWRAVHSSRYSVGPFRIAHPAAVAFPGISFLAVMAFITAILGDHTIAGKPWYTVTLVAALFVFDIYLTVTVVIFVWKARDLRAFKS